MQNKKFMLQSWNKVIMHLDGDAFFASCEQSLHPEYKGKPIVTGQERNIIASMSYEAKARGIKRGCAVWEARKICPDLIVVPSDYETYSLLSKRMFSIVRRFTPIVEESSIDEGYADLKGLRRLYRKGYEGIAQEIQETIAKELGFTISVGLSLTKTLSKLAAKFKKPHGLTVVKGYRIHEFLRQNKVEEVCGIGPNTTALLHKHNVFTAYDFAVQPMKWAQRMMGKIGVELWQELRGVSVYGLDPEEKTSYQSILKSKTFTPPSSDYTYVHAQLLRNIESAFIKMRRYKIGVSRVAIFLKEQDFKGSGIEFNLNRATDVASDIFSLVDQELQNIFNVTKEYRATGVCLTKLKSMATCQFDLFEDPLRVMNMRQLGGAIDAINRRYGKHAVYSGTGLYLTKNKKTLAEEQGRYVVAQRKKELLKGETFRRRIRIPIWQVKV